MIETTEGAGSEPASGGLHPVESQRSWGARADFEGELNDIAENLGSDEPDDDTDGDEVEPDTLENAGDPPAPTADEAPFAVLPDPLRRALEARGFESFTAVQAAVLEAVGQGSDLRISSQTGSGKTVALGLAMAHDVLADARGAGPGGSRVLDVARPTREVRGPVALVIVPTRELAAQVAEELTWLFAEVPGASVDVVTGGTSVPLERRRLARSPRILVGTPGRLLDHITSGALRVDAVQQLVLDEADQMLDMGFRDELEAILEKTPAERHTHLVSATFPEGIKRLAEQYQRSAKSVEGTALGAVNADISHVAHLVRPDHRYDVLINLLLLAGGERTLVFVNTRVATGELSARLAEDGFGAQPLSGELQQAQRTRTLAAFRAGTAPVLVATDVAARGLDVPDVALVIHTAVPIDSETYIHRSGRTGRAGQHGHSVLMVAPSRERRANRMLSEAGIDLDWRDVPRGREVQAALDERAAAALKARLELAATEAGAPTPGQLALARTLLEERDAALVVAALLPAAMPNAGTQPRSLADAPRPRALENAARDRSRGPRGGGQAFGARRDYESGPRGGYESGPRGGYESGPRGGYESAPRRGYESGPRGGGEFVADRFEGAGSPAHHAAPAAFEAPEHSREEFMRGADRRESRHRGGDSYVRFRVNWGFRGGANPRRLLATLCRRGGVTNREIGSIDIAPAFSTFEVAGHAAEAFAERAGRDDPRDPGLWVAPDRAPEPFRRPPRFRSSRRG